MTAKSGNMLLVLFFLVFLIIDAPAILVFDGPIVHGLITAAAAVLLALIGLRIRPGEAGFLAAITRPIAAVAAVPALWMVVQVLPLQAVGLANPIWESAAAAIGQPLAGSISIDRGATLVALAQYLSIAAIAFVAAAVAIDRHRAKWVLFALTAAATLIALMAIAARFGDFIFLSTITGSMADNAATDSAALGVNLAAAAALQTLELRKLQRIDRSETTNWYALTFAACLAAIALCLWVVIMRATSQTYFAVACGIATLVVSILIRGFRFGPWGISAVLSAVAVSMIAIAAFQPGNRSIGLTLAFATHAPPPLVALTQRILTETSLTGTGAGTFAAVLPIYRDVDELTAGPRAPTAASAVAVEMGQPFLWAGLMAATAFVVILLRGAIQRGRDSFYSAAGASSIVTATLLAFGNNAVLSTCVLMFIAVVLGIAIAQSKSRSI